MRETLESFCTRSGQTALLAEWDAERNLPDTPAGVTRGSHKKVFWRCENGHTWQAAVYTRTSGSGCPYCQGRQARAGFNDLRTRFPSLAAEWDAEKNAPLTPEQVTIGSHQEVFWRCAHGHSWKAAVRARTRGSGCPVCAGRQVSAGQNDLASCLPVLAAEWDAEKNGALTPQSVTPSSNRKVFWRCPHGHSYAARISARTECGTGCPYCAGRKVLAGFNDLQTVFPKLAAEWHPTLNGALTPEQLTPGSNKRVWWQCSLGHVWKAVVYSRTGPRPSGCPVCAGKTRPARRTTRQKSNGAAVFDRSNTLSK